LKSVLHFKGYRKSSAPGAGPMETRALDPGAAQWGRSGSALIENSNREKLQKSQN
jgi:hypothetical protein